MPGAGAGAVSWLCAWWRQGAGAGGGCWLCAWCTRKIIRPYRSADRCFKRATKSIVALDTAWPWANDTYGLCCLRAYFCAHKLIRAKIIRWYSPNRDSKNELAARAFERVSVLVLVLWSWVLVL